MRGRTRWWSRAWSPGRLRGDIRQVVYGRVYHGGVTGTRGAFIYNVWHHD